MNNVIAFGYGSNIILRQTQLNSLQLVEFAWLAFGRKSSKHMMEYCELFSKELFYSLANLLVVAFYSILLSRLNQD